MTVISLCIGFGCEEIIFALGRSHRPGHQFVHLLRIAAYKCHSEPVYLQDWILHLASDCHPVGCCRVVESVEGRLRENQIGVVRAAVRIQSQRLASRFDGLLELPRCTVETTKVGTGLWPILNLEYRV